MKGSCPSCEKETSLIFKREIEEIEIRGEKFPVTVEYYQCQTCGEEFEDPKSAYDPVEVAYRKYREKHAMVQPEGIREFRNKYGLTQKEFSSLLGIGIATLSRYENGALQDEAHDRILKLAMAPGNFLQLLNEHPEALPQEKRRRLIFKLKEDKEKTQSIASLLLNDLSAYEADIFSGYRKFDIDKFLNVVKYFCYPEPVVKTKLTKLLFYADFLHFHNYTVSITGSRYAHLPHGPVPDNYDLIFWMLLKRDPELRKEEAVYGEFVGEDFISGSPPDYSVFAPTELNVISSLMIEFKDVTARVIRDYSHQEEGYKKTKDGELISFKFADDLRLFN